MTPIPVLHIINRLIVGGAQENTMLSADLLDPDRYAVDVIAGPQTGPGAPSPRRFTRAPPLSGCTQSLLD